MVTIYSWLSDEENAAMNRAENPKIFKKLDATLKKIKRAKRKKHQV